jgi:hypothetical protein
VLIGNKAGYETSTPNPAGSYRLYYEFNDRGRGPRITEDVLLESDQIPLATNNTGIDYHKAPVEEHYSLTEGKAAWKNRAEEDRQQISGRAFYVSISGVPGRGSMKFQLRKR